MDQIATVAEELPVLYRAVLDVVFALEQVGERREASIVRAQATRLYSGSWDESSRRGLHRLWRRADRVVNGRERPRRDSRVRLALVRQLTPGR